MEELVLRKNLEKYLKDFEVTAAELSRKTGISKQVISDWMAGRMPRDLRKIRLVAEFFNITIEDLCFRKAEKSDQESLEKKLSISGDYEIHFYRIAK